MSLARDSHIVIVDDLPDMRAGLSRALAQLGFGRVTVCASGPEVLAALKTQGGAALVISDWNMEPMDGLALLAAIHAEARTAAIPFILVSAEAGPFRRNQAAEAGVSLFLAKPFTPEELSQAIGTIAPVAGQRSAAAGG